MRDPSLQAAQEQMRCDLADALDAAEASHSEAMEVGGGVDMQVGI
jgi:hypothetical protein